MKIHLSSQVKINEAIKQLAEIVPNGEFEIQIKKLPKTRTALQNRALHKYFDLIANEMNLKDLTVQEVLSHGIERHWDRESVKALLWKPLQKAVTGNNETSTADTKAYSKVYMYLSHFLATKFGITTPFPQREILD